jgi:hypothetical protein
VRGTLRSLALAVACTATLLAEALVRDPRALVRAMPRDGWTDALQRAFWLPWQLGDNLRHGRSVWDASVFVGPHGASLVTLVGNPGAAVLGAPFHTVLVPTAAHAAWMLTTVASGAWAGAELARRLGVGRTRDAFLGAALVAGCVTWTTDLADGAMAAGWVAPAFAVLAGGGNARVMAAAGAVGALAAPVPTAIAALLSRALIAERPSRHGRGLDLVAGAIVVVACGVRLMWPPLGADVPVPATALRALVPLSVVGHAVPPPVWTLPGLAALAHGGGRTRLAAAIGAVVLVLVVTAPAASWQREALSAVLVVAAVGVLRVVTAFPRLVWGAALWMLTEPSLLASRGVPARPWTGPPWDVPAPLAALARTPRAHLVLHAPVLTTREGAVGLLPFHQQRVVGGPGLHADGPARTALHAWMKDVEALRTVARAGDEPLVRASPSPAFQLAQLGIDRVVALGGDPVLRTGLTRLLGPSADGVWTLAVPGRGQHRPPPPPGAAPFPPPTPDTP